MNVPDELLAYRPSAAKDTNLAWFVVPILLIAGLTYLLVEGNNRLQSAEAETARLRQQLAQMQSTSPDMALERERRLLQQTTPSTTPRRRRRARPLQP